MEKNTGDFLQSSKSVPSVWPSRALLRQAICPTSLGKSVRFLLGCRLLRVARRDNSPARKRRFSEAIQADLGRPVPLPKILCLCCRANQRHRLRPSRLDTRGASRSSRTLGAGCDGRFGDARRAALVRTAKPCGPDAPTLASSWRSDPQAMVARKPGHQGERVISRRTIAQGRPDCFGEPVVTTLVRFFVCVRGCGCIGHPAFPVPSHFRGRFPDQLGRFRAAGE